MSSSDPMAEARRQFILSVQQHFRPLRLVTKAEVEAAMTSVMVGGGFLSRQACRTTILEALAASTQVLAAVPTSLPPVPHLDTAALVHSVMAFYRVRDAITNTAREFGFEDFLFWDELPDEPVLNNPEQVAWLSQAVLDSVTVAFRLADHALPIVMVNDELLSERFAQLSGAISWVNCLTALYVYGAKWLDTLDPAGQLLFEVRPEHAPSEEDLAKAAHREAYEAQLRRLGSN